MAREGDQRAHRLLLGRLDETRPDDAVLSEEGTDDARRLGNSRLWVIDPLDGSRDYGFGNDEWAVHVGLVEDGQILAGAVALPALDLLFHTGDGDEASGAEVSECQTFEQSTDVKAETAIEVGEEEFRETGETDAAVETLAKQDEAAAESDLNRRPVIVTARSRANAEGMLLAHELGADVFACGSAGVKAMLVVNGTADAYVHASPLYEWDVCAPAAVAQSAGLHVSDAAGEPLVFNQARPVVNSFVVCRPELAANILSALSNLGYFRSSASISRLRF